MAGTLHESDRLAHLVGYGRMFTRGFKTKTHAVVAVLLLLACGDSGTGPTAPPTTPPTPTPTAVKN